jgi:hypothetical protein
LKKSKIVEAVFIKFTRYFTKNIVVKSSIRPDIRYPALGLAGYPAKTVSGASLILIQTNYAKRFNGKFKILSARLQNTSNKRRIKTKLK